VGRAPHAGPPGGALPGMCATIAMPFRKARPLRDVHRRLAAERAERIDDACVGCAARPGRKGSIDPEKSAHPPQPWAVGDRTC
jgi:hypothetical protein